MEILDIAGQENKGTSWRKFYASKIRTSVRHAASLTPNSVGNDFLRSITFCAIYFIRIVDYVWPSLPRALNQN
jgi:hypothetical protein